LAITIRKPGFCASNSRTNDSAVLPNISQYCVETIIFDDAGNFSLGKYPDATKTITRNVEINKKASILRPKVEGALSGFPPVCRIFFLAGNCGLDFAENGFFSKRGFFSERNFIQSNFAPLDKDFRNIFILADNFASNHLNPADRYFQNSLILLNRRDRNDFALEARIAKRADICETNLM